MRVTWIQPDDLLRHEFVQSAAEGRDVSSQVEAWIASGASLAPPAGGASAEPASPAQLALADRLLAELDALPSGTGDPSEPAAIRALCGPTPGLPRRPGDEELADRIHGAWLGRAAGCLLGKPVEKIPREGIREILQAQGRWPLRQYFSGLGIPPELAARRPWNRASRSTSLLEVMDGMPEDDDINYTMLALAVMECHGRDFETEDVAAYWLAELPAGRLFTAERVAYRNLLEGLEPPLTATVRNPFREWIGAQIRTDLYGWVNPGDVWAAADLAWRDARLSHTRNGLYGAMFAAALGAAALVCKEPRPAVEAALGVVPPESRLAEAVRLGVITALEERHPERALDRLEQAYGDLHWVHAVNNAALVAYGFVAGDGDFGRSICLTVSGGWDTDSNGATVGGAAGALIGAAGLPAEWTVPLRNRISSTLRGFDGAAFDELARRTARLISA